MFQVQLKESGIICAVKVPLPRGSISDSAGLSRTTYSEREYKILLALEQAGCTTRQNRSGTVGLVRVGKLQGCIKVGSEYLIVMSYVEAVTYGSVVSVPEDKEAIRCWSYSCALLESLKTLHAAGYVHGDIKYENFLYQGHTVGVGSLVDFTFTALQGSMFLAQCHEALRLGMCPPLYAVAAV